MRTQSSLSGQVVMATGAASGIGRAFVERAAAEGARIAALDLDEERLHSLVDGLPGPAALALPADVSDSDQVATAVDAVVERWGRIDSCLNNAGIAANVSPLPDYPGEEFKKVVDVNLYGCFHVLKHVMKVMRDQRAGSIVNTASAAGLRGLSGIAPYVASKHAVVGLTKTAALEGLEYGVRVNAICPGVTETPINDGSHRFANPGDPDAAREEFAAQIPIRRYADPSEPAAVAAFLLSEDASYVVGEIVSVDGALTTGV